MEYLFSGMDGVVGRLIFASLFNTLKFFMMKKIFFLLALALATFQAAGQVVTMRTTTMVNYDADGDTRKETAVSQTGEWKFILSFVDNEGAGSLAIVTNGTYNKLPLSNLAEYFNFPGRYKFFANGAEWLWDTEKNLLAEYPNGGPVDRIVWR